MKLISWNVNGIRAVLKKGFRQFLEAEQPDILCLQETRAEASQVLDPLWHSDYNAFWNAAEKKGYSGTAIFSKTKPLTVSLGLGVKQHDREGRVITAEYERFYLVNVYVPNSGRELARLEYRRNGTAPSCVILRNSRAKSRWSSAAISTWRTSRSISRARNKT